MLRYLILFALLIAIVFGAVWVADHPGRLTIEWLGYVIEPTIGAAIAILLLVVMVLYLVLRSLDEIFSIPKKVKQRHYVRKLEKGVAATNEGFLAIATGRERHAIKQANKAHKLLDQPMTLMLKAQAAQLAGKDKDAQQYFAQLKGNSETAFVGTQSLLTQARKQGDTEQSYALAKEAHAMQPQNESVTRMLVHSQMEKSEWREAHHTLLNDARDRGLSKEERNKLLQLVLIERSREHSNLAEPEPALEHAHRAWGMNKQFVPAVNQYAIALNPTKPLKALKLLEDSWNESQHPALLETHTLLAEQALAKQFITAPEWRKRLKRLTSSNLSNTASMQLALAKAQAALADDDIEIVKQLLADQDKNNPTVLRLLATVTENNENQQQLLTTAEQTTPLKLWDCHDCDNLQETWDAVCPVCGGIDTLRYRAV